MNKEKTQEKTKDEALTELKEDIGAILDGMKELTKVVGDLAKEHEKWRVAGKF
jgi:hypothetical protein